MGKVHVIVFRNTISVPSMENNLVLPFIMREASLVVKDTSKIHAMDLSMEEHSIYFTKFEIRIPLCLHGAFSYLLASKPSIVTLKVTNWIYLINPEGICNS